MTSSHPIGAFAAEGLLALHREGHILRDGGLDSKRVQPASLDLTLSSEAWRLPASVLPQRGESVRDLLTTFARRPLDLTEPEPLSHHLQLLGSGTGDLLSTHRDVVSGLNP